MSRSKKTQAIKPKFDTTPYQRPGLNEVDILEIKQIFDMYDCQHIGSINPQDIKQALANLGPEARNESIYQLAVDLCSEGRGNISFEDFIHLMTPKLLSSDTPENIDKLFSLFDTSKTGFISLSDLRRIAHEMALECSDQDLQDMIKRADSDLDGLVSREEFFALMAGDVAE